MDIVSDDPVLLDKVRTYVAAIELIRANDNVRVLGRTQRITMQDYWRLTTARSQYDKLRNGSHGHSRY